MTLLGKALNPTTARLAHLNDKESEKKERQVRRVMKRRVQAKEMNLLSLAQAINMHIGYEVDWKAEKKERS